MRKLIVNADDFGFTRGVNQAVVSAHRNGILTSTTLMANGDAFDDAVVLAADNPELGVGCHIAVVGGRPVSDPSEIPSLVDGEGVFPPTLSKLCLGLLTGSIRERDLEIEMRAQIRRIISSGIVPTHVDTHKHSHIHPVVLRCLIRTAKEFGITRIRNPFEKIGSPSPGTAARSKRCVFFKQHLTGALTLIEASAFRRAVSRAGLMTTDHFSGIALTGLLDAEAVRRTIDGLGEGVTELMCHPGFFDRDLEMARTRLRNERLMEYNALIDPEVRIKACSTGIGLISYRELE